MGVGNACENRLLGSPLSISDLAGMAWGQRFCISHKCPADTDDHRNHTLKSTGLEEDNINFKSYDRIWAKTEIMSLVCTEFKSHKNLSLVKSNFPSSHFFPFAYQKKGN